MIIQRIYRKYSRWSINATRVRKYFYSDDKSISLQKCTKSKVRNSAKKIYIEMLFISKSSY